MPVLSLRSSFLPRSSPRPLRPLPAVDDAPLATRRVSSHLLLDGQRELVIQHQGSEYHLRLTRNDKLILTK